MNEASLHEKIGSLQAEMRLVLVEMTLIKRDLHMLTENMNKGKGWGAAMMFISSILGASMFKIFTTLSK